MRTTASAREDPEVSARGAFDPQLDGRTAAVIGVGPGIGLQTAMLLGALGARVVAVDIDRDRSANAVAQLPGDGHEPFAADVRSSAEVAGLHDEVSHRVGDVDVLVNVVGIGGPAVGVDALDDAVWDSVLDLNLRQQFIVARPFFKDMVARGSGSMVVVSSINATGSSPMRAPYGVAKAGLDSLVRTMAIEGAPFNVRVNSVRPGATLTPRRQHLGEGELGELYRREIPLGRLGDPRDVANAIVFLASGLAGHITGQSVVIDGGSTIRYCQPAGN